MTVKVKIDTAKLDKIVKQVAGNTVKDHTIADGVEYGVFQELTASGHPSLVPAFEKVTRSLPDAIGQAIENGQDISDVFDKAAFDIQALWATDVNVDTGAYRNSIHVEVD